MFQVNQKTKSGKWKCRMCGEPQSIVKVWGRSGQAKDVRRLVMDLNATAGRGEDVGGAIENLSSQLEARDVARPSLGFSDKEVSAALEPSRSAAGNSSRLSVSWGQKHKGLVPASLAPPSVLVTRDSCEDSRPSGAVQRIFEGGHSWGDGRIAPEHGSNRLDDATYESCGTGTGTDGDRNTTRQAVAERGRYGRSRWGVFASMDNNGPVDTWNKRKREMPRETEQDPKPVTSLARTTREPTDGRHRESKKRTLQAGFHTSKKRSDDVAMSGSRWRTVRGQGERSSREDGLQISPGLRRPRGQKEAEADSVPVGDRASADAMTDPTDELELRRSNSRGFLASDAGQDPRVLDSNRLPRHVSQSQIKGDQRRNDSSSFRTGSRWTDDATGSSVTGSSSRWGRFVA